MPYKKPSLPRFKQETTEQQPGVIADGHAKLRSGIQEDARRIVEEKYADQWNSSGLLDRWRLQRRMSKEIAELVAEMSPNVSPESLF